MGTVLKPANTIFAAICSSALSTSAMAQLIDAAGATPMVEPVVAANDQPEEVLVTARKREEEAQRVPIALTVVPVAQLEATGDYNVGQISTLVPTVQFFSSNPRNTAITIRGLGTSFGLTNDGLESGVGLYVDQVYMSRPAAATFDFVDVDQIEVLRGPQGTLFGKNTTAGAINIGIKPPSFEREIEAEVSGGDYGFWQGKASISGALAGDVLAGRLSVTGSLRDGMLHNVTTGKDINNENNIGTRAQILYRPDEDFSLRLTGDYSHQQSVCCALGFVRVGETLKPAAQQFPALAAAAVYAPASTNPFDRKIDTNTPAQANQVLSGISAIVDWDLGAAAITSVSAWRTWNWDPSSDRDFTRLSIQTMSQNPDNQNQYSEELRVASNGQTTLDYVAGLYYFRQMIDATPVSQWGADATRWLLTPVTLPANLLDGYTATGIAHSDTASYAAFAQLTWNITPRLHVTPGLRYTYEDKSGSFDQSVSGGHPRSDANHDSDVAKLNSIARDQHYSTAFTDGSLSGQVNASYDLADNVMAYGTYSKGHKSGGINLAGIPVDALGNPVASSAIVKPEGVGSYEFGLKNQFFGHRLTLNADIFDSEIRNYQVNVADSGPGALRGYLSNIKKVSSRGFELDSAFAISSQLSAYLSGAWTEGKYDNFANGPCLLEATGTSTVACDLSGRRLPGLSKWALSFGGEYRRPIYEGMGYFGVDASYRSSAYSDASDSKYLLIGDYTLLNVRAGFISSGAWEIFAWVKNVFDTHYFQYLQAQPGNSGAVFGLPGNPRTFGITLRWRS